LASDEDELQLQAMANVKVYAGKVRCTECDFLLGTYVQEQRTYFVQAQAVRKYRVQNHHQQTVQQQASKAARMDLVSRAELVELREEFEREIVELKEFVIALHDHHRKSL